MKSRKKKTFVNLILFFLLIILTFYFVLRDQNISDIGKALINVNKWYILLAVVCMFLYLVFESINLGRTLKALGEKSTFLKNLKYAFIGFFFSSITPAASGGQPMQIYYMYKDDINIANSTLALLINLCSFQIVTISFALISVGINAKYLTTGLIWFFVLGITLNSMALSLLLIGIFSKKLSKWLVNFAIKILKFFRFKRIEKLEDKLKTTLDKYQGSAEYIKNNKLIILKTLLTTFIQMMIYYSIPFWVYCSFGLSDKNIFQIITLQAVLYATVSGIPSPGAVGVSEGGFLGIFETVFSTELVGSAMLLNRGVSFYLYVIISSIIVIVSILRIKNGEKEITET